MELAIKNMVCHHCIHAVEHVISSLGLHAESVTLGKAVISEPGLDGPEMAELRVALSNEGFELIEDSAGKLVEEIKHAVMHHVRSERECRLNLSACLEEHLGVSYVVMTRAFSAREGRTIEKYSIAQRVEYVKELLQYGELPLSEIAHVTGYSGVAHLCRQFKDVTGLTTGEFRENAKGRKPLNIL